MKNPFYELFRYNLDTNKDLIDHFRSYSGKCPERSVQLLNHIIDVHHVWNSRILGIKGTFTAWQVHPENELEPINRNNYTTTLSILETMETNRLIPYTNSNGEHFVNTVEDILYHIINHSTYHRGQIALEFRQNQLEPLATDYIFYRRNWETNPDS